MRVAIVLSVLLVCASASAEADIRGPEPIPAVHTPGVPLNVARICYDVVYKDLGETEWNRFVIKAQQKYKDWSRDYDTDNIKRFLDDKLLMLAPGIMSGKGEKLKEFACWLALYEFFYEPVPRYLSELSAEDRASIQEELRDFDWDRCALRFKQKAEER